MTATTTEQTIDRRYPSAGLDWYHGRRVWTLGEDGDQYLVEGHGRRALAALNGHLRYEYGTGGIRPSDLRITEGYVVFVETCGCTAEDHAAHHPRPVTDFGEHAHLFGDVVDGKVLTDCDCDDPGLPPCRDAWGWVAHPRVDGLPVLWVQVMDR